MTDAAGKRLELCDQTLSMRDKMKKAPKDHSSEASDITDGRCERIRTFDPLHPMQVRYQAAPHTEQAYDYNVLN